MKSDAETPQHNDQRTGRLSQLPLLHRLLGIDVISRGGGDESRPREGSSEPLCAPGRLQPAMSGNLLDVVLSSAHLTSISLSLPHSLSFSHTFPSCLVPEDLFNFVDSCLNGCKLCCCLGKLQCACGVGVGWGKGRWRNKDIPGTFLITFDYWVD